MGNAIDTNMDEGWVEGGEDAYLDQTWEDKYELGTTDDEWYGSDGYDSDNYDTEDDE